MRTLAIAIGILLVVHLLAVGAGVGYLAATDRLSSERVRTAMEIFTPTIAEEEAAAAEAEALAREAAETRERAIRLASVAHGPRTLEQRLAEDGQVDQVTEQRIQRLQREREDLLRQIEAAKAVISRQQADISAREEAFEQRVAQVAAERADADFREAVAMLEQLKPKQAKAVLQDMLAGGDQEAVVTYLAEMNLRKAGAVLREFKDEQEIVQARSLIEALRQRGVVPS